MPTRLFFLQKKKKNEMANYLAAIAQSSYCMVRNNVLRAYESYRLRKKLLLILIGRLPCVHFFVHNVMFILVSLKFDMLSKII